MKNVITWMFWVGASLGTQDFVLRQEKDLELTVHFQTDFQGETIALNKPLQFFNGDSLALHTLRFYLSNFVFSKNGFVVFEEKNSPRLLDLEDERTLALKFQLPENTVFDSLKFEIGIDSLTNVSGAMGGDLDPTKGMFWTWQSGYINVKLEGFFEKCPTRNHEFQFHLGGYLAPNQSIQSVSLSATQGKKLKLQLDLTPFFDSVDWVKKHSIMSPSKEAVVLSKILANSFSIHGE